MIKFATSPAAVLHVSYIPDHIFPPTACPAFERMISVKMGVVRP